MSLKLGFLLCGIALLAASGAQAGEVRPLAAKSSAVSLVDTIAARNALPLTGSWEVLVPERVVDTAAEGVSVVVTLYGLRDGSDIHALLLTQRNVLPGASGWGAPAACDDHELQLRLVVYQSPRDVLCGWARTVSFSPADQTQLGSFAQAAADGKSNQFGSLTGSWMWYGLRVSNRSDFLDMQLLVPNKPEIPQAESEKFIADMAHSMGATWLTGGLAAVAPPTPKPPPEPTGSWWQGTLSTSAMKTMTYRVGVSIKTFMVASLMAGDAVTGGAIIGVLNFTSTGIYLLNDYVWETWRPLTPEPQDFVRLVNTQ